jgi:putative oxidoreductase
METREEGTAMAENPQGDLFAPILDSDALMGPLLLTARLFTTGIFILEIVKTPMSGGLIFLALAAQFIGIVMVALGYNTRFAALLLAAFCIVAALPFRASAEFANLLQTHLQKDLSVAAGFLFMFAYGPGPLSLDAYLSRGKSGEVGNAIQPGFLSSILRNDFVMGTLLFTGRILFIWIFVSAGINKIVHTTQMQDYMVKHNSSVPTSLIYVGILAEIVPPVMVLFGNKTRYAALILSGFTIIATVLFHHQFADLREFAHFMLDFAIAGGFLFLFAYGPGPFSLDARQRGINPQLGESRR